MQQNILTHYCNNISKSCKKRDAILSSTGNSTNVAPLAKIIDVAEKLALPQMILQWKPI